MLFESLFQHADRKPHELAIQDDTGRYTWQQFAAAAAGLGLYLSVQTDTPCVELTYANLTSDVDACIQHAQLQTQHSFLGILPLFHSTGLLATLIAPVRLGSMTVYQARFSPTKVIDAIKEHRISIIVAVPSMYGALARMKDVGPAEVTSLYAALSGGEPLPSAIRIAFEQKFGVPIYEGYGLTETIGPIAFNVPGAIEPGSVGKPIPGAEVRITEEGEVWLKGPMIMRGYHNLPD